MADTIIMEGDQAIFLPAFGNAIVVVQPGVMKASGKTAINGKKVCVAGDEGDVSVPGCLYTTASHPIPGTGTLKISALGSDQQTTKTKSGGKAILLKGSTFTAAFEVQSPAQQPTASGPVPDSSPKYSGSGNFVSANLKFKAS